MHGRSTLLFCALGLAVMTMAAAPSVGSAEGGAHSGSAEGGAQLEECQGTKALSETAGTHPSPTGHSCWVEVQPYPFGPEGEPVNPSTCATGQKATVGKCYLDVTSMAFRAWNRGLAITKQVPGSEGPSGSEGPNPGVWAFNGTNWSPVPTFPGKPSCLGEKVVWAGKLDYWVIGGEHTRNWPNLCRFDGVHLAWESLEIPPATKEHVVEGENGKNEPVLKRGGINSAACFAWNNCWFLGSYGTVVHWNGKVLSDASPDRSQALLQGEYNAAVAREGPAGEAFGLAVGSTSAMLEQPPLQTQANGAPPAQLYGSSGGAFTPLAFTPFTLSLAGDPYRTDLVAVDLGAAGQGWVAGNPTQREEPHGRPQPAPLEPVSTSGAASACAGLPEERFMYSPPPTTGSAAFEWLSIAVIPATGEAFAGGKMRPEKAGEGQNEDATHFEPVIARANCRETTTITRFRIENPSRSPGLEAPADREGGAEQQRGQHEGSVTAIAANASNDAWAATGVGTLVEPPPLNPVLPASEYYEPPHLYRLTNGRPPGAPAETNPAEPLRLKEEAEGQEEGPPPPEELPPQPPAPEPPVTETRTQAIRLPAALYDVKARLHTTNNHGHLDLSLYLTFKLRRPITIGAQALRHGRVVSVAKPRHFAGHSGLLILSLNRKRWPTNVKFVS